MGVDGSSDPDYSLKGAETAFQAMVPGSRLRLGLRLASPEDQTAPIDRELDGPRIHAGQLEFHHQVAGGFVDVHVGNPRGGRVVASVYFGKVLEETIDLVLNAIQLKEGSEGFHGEALAGSASNIMVGSSGCKKAGSR